MTSHLSRTAWLPILLLTASGAGRPVLAQFDEPDTIPRFALGPIIELTFRGSLGDLADGRSIDLSNGPTFGARAEVRLSRTGSLIARGSYGRTEEKVETGMGDAAFFGNMTQIEVAGELLLKVKPSVPGFFLIGGGARFVDPDEDDPVDPSDDRFTRSDSYSEPVFIGGLGLDLGARRRNTFRIEGRFYFSVPAEQERFDTNSVVTDFALGFSYLRRI